MVDWSVYLAPWINDNPPPGAPTRPCTSSASSRSSPGLTVALRPALWRAARRRLARRKSFSTCSPYSGYYDIALRDFGLMLGALTLARLATVYDR